MSSTIKAVVCNKWGLKSSPKRQIWIVGGEVVHPRSPDSDNIGSKCFEHCFSPVLLCHRDHVIRSWDEDQYRLPFDARRIIDLMVHLVVHDAVQESLNWGC